MLSSDQLTAAFHDMVLVEGGTFMMGSDDPEDSWFGAEARPAHRVQVSDFHIGKYPVTQALWSLVMKGENPSYFRGKRKPVDQVSWEDIVEQFLPRFRELTGQPYRLPTEAEWEYAARGGRHQEGFAYSGSHELATVGWFGENSHRGTMPVGVKAPNALGLYDMSGNVWEWCQDWFDEGYYQACYEQGLVIDPAGAAEGSNRMDCGGSWDLRAQDCRVALRGLSSPGYRYRNLGFRLSL
jgi:formylglycine-generating enzyme required for sulfatase activity